MADLLDSAHKVLNPPAVGSRRGPTLHLVSDHPATVELDVIIPAYNEESRIGPTLRALSETLSLAGISARLLVVDNGSVDRTVELVQGMATRLPVEVLNCRHKGKGAAVRAGIEVAEAPYVGYVDADDSTPPAALLTALTLLGHGWDGVIGSRRALGGRYVVPQPALRRIGSRAFNLAAMRVVGRVSDTQCGMKVFCTEAVRDVFAQTTTAGFAFDVEVLARAQAAGLRIMELPVEWSDVEGSTFSPLRHGIAAFRDLAGVRRTIRASTRHRR